jgi:hypothetical protein
MALIKSYELNSGLECPEAYHVIHNVVTNKRLVDDEDPGGVRPDNSPDHAWKAGYYGRVSVVVYASKAAREAGKQAIAAYAQYPTEVPGGNFQGEVNIMQIEDMNYTIDLASEKSIVEQGYDHLISLPTWSDAVND